MHLVFSRSLLSCYWCLLALTCCRRTSKACGKLGATHPPKDGEISTLNCHERVDSRFLVLAGSEFIFTEIPGYKYFSLISNHFEFKYKSDKNIVPLILSFFSFCLSFFLSFFSFDDPT